MGVDTYSSDGGPVAGEADRGLREDGSRRRFLELAGAGGAALAMSTLVAACGGDDEPQQQDTRDAGDPTQPSTDLEIINYALLLEYLEEDFYKLAVDSGELRSEYQTLALEIRGNETEHVQALESLVEQLAGVPVPRPEPKFDAVIQGGEQSILDTAATLENVGAAAYLGQAPRIQNTRVLESALAIHTVEARHAAALNEIAGNGFSGGDPLSGSIPNGAFGRPMTREEVLQETAPFIKA